MAVAERSATVSILRVPGVPGVELTEVVGAEIPRAPRVVSAYEIAICQEGEIQFFRRGRIRAFTPGLISLAQPGEVIRVFRTSGWVRYQSVQLEPAVVGECEGPGRPLEGTPYHFREPHTADPVLAGCLSKLIAAIKVAPADVPREIAALVACVRAEHWSDAPPPPRQHTRVEAVRRVREYLESHYAEHVPLETLARQVDVTTSHLIRLFRAHVGLPPHAYQARVRVNRARTLLRDGVRPADVATETGFSDQSHLTREFRRVVGVTPGRYQAAS
jgi:AraC-like DNA-binding protein